jgi:cytochrome c biogenesis protein
VRALRSKPRALGTLSGQQQYTAGTIRVDATPALDAAEHVLKGKRFRSWRDEGTVAAEKGHLREGGSLIFHTAFLVLLLGMSIGKAFGFSGQALVIEGDRFTDTHLDYDSIEEGRFFSERHRGFTLRQDAFEVDWFDDGVPKYFRSRITLFEGEREIGARTIEVNKPLEHSGIKIYQLSWGWAPVVRVEQAGRVLYDGPTVVLQRNGVWRGVVKVPQTKPQQVGFELYFFANPVIGPDNFPVDVTPDARNPLVVAQMYQGDLGLTVPQSVYELDMRSLVPSGDLAALTPGRAQRLPNDVTITFTGLKKYSVFQIASNPGAPILLLAAVMILVGLIPALYSSRRRVWVRVQPAGAVSRLEIAGHALQRKAAFEEEFKTLVRELDEKLYAAGGARTEERVGASDG